MSGQRDEDEREHLGWHVIAGADLLTLMRRCTNGEDADLVFAEVWANAEHYNMGGGE